MPGRLGQRFRRHSLDGPAGRRSAGAGRHHPADNRAVLAGEPDRVAWPTDAGHGFKAATGIAVRSAESLTAPPTESAHWRLTVPPALEAPVSEIELSPGTLSSTVEIADWEESARWHCTSSPTPASTFSVAVAIRMYLPAGRDSEATVVPLVLSGADPW